MQSKKGKQRFLLLLPAMLLAFLLTGCTRETAAEAIGKAQESLQSIESMRYTLTMDTKMSAEGQTVQMKTLAGVDYIREPQQMKMEIASKINGVGGINMISYMTETDGVYTLYSGLDMGEQTYWQKSEPENTDSFTQYNAESNLELYLSCAEPFEAAGEGTLSNGMETIRYNGILSGEQLEKVIVNAGISSQMESMGFDASLTQAMFRELGDLPISIWIEKDTYMPVQYEMDMTAVMQGMISGMMKSLNNGTSPDITVDRVYICMTVQSVNDVDQIEIPEEALAAESAEAGGAMETPQLVEQELTDENYQTFFRPATDFGYEYVGRAYCKAPQDMFGKESFLDAYLPYGDNLTYSEDGQTLWSSAHGMLVLQTTAYTEEDARAVVEQAYQELVDSGIDFLEGEVGETQYDASYDIAFKPVGYYEDTENGKQPRIAVLYADNKQEHYYLYAQITYLPEQFDEQYPQMLEELRDAFGLSLPQYTLSEFY